jgi:hypothetical protein
LRVLNLKLFTLPSNFDFLKGHYNQATKKIMMKNKENNTQADLEWEQRTLCSDESCIGVIGPDGLCKECGKPYESEEQEGNSKEEIGNSE